MKTATAPAGSKSTGPHTVDMQEWVAFAPFEQLLNMEIVEAVDGTAMLRMPFYRDFAQGIGYMHGGVLASLADTAVMIAIKTLLTPGTRFATVSMQMDFIRPVKQGMVTAKSRVIERDGRLIKGEAVLYDDEQQSVLEFSSVFKLARRQPALENGGED